MKEFDVLVIGSAHIDILADYNKETENDINKAGDILIGVGGVGFNIAANLSFHGISSRLYTVIKANSYSGNLIKSSMIKRGMSTEFLLEMHSGDSEIGFVAHRLEGRLVTGVASTLVDLYPFQNHSLQNAINRANVIAVDCNLSAAQITQIRSISKKLAKPLFVCSVAENKVKRAIGQKPGVYYKLFCLNSKEAEKESFPRWDINAQHKTEISQFCRFYHSENVVVTNGKHGYTVYTIKGERLDFPKPSAKVKSELGAGDALFSAALNNYLDHDDFNWLLCEKTIADYVKKALSSPRATPDTLPDDHKHKHKKRVTIIYPSEYRLTYQAIAKACSNLGVSHKGADDIWLRTAFINDIEDMIRSSDIIIADITGKNPNVFYEIGIAHQMGKTIIPISQDSLEDMPEDIRHMSVQIFHPGANDNAYEGLTIALQKRLDVSLSKLV
jgi:sugar/nucleoside kinase (ribokinase family)